MPSFFTREFASLVAAGLVIVAGLIWQETFQEIFKCIFPTRDTLLAKLMYAIVTTIIIVVIIYWLYSRFNLDNPLLE